MEILDSIEEVFSFNLVKLRGPLTQEQAAERLGMKKSTYINLEQGTTIPQKATRSYLAQKYDIPESSLFADPDLVIQPSLREALEIVKKALDLAADLAPSAQRIVGLLAPLDENEARTLLPLVEANINGILSTRSHSDDLKKSKKPSG